MSSLHDPMKSPPRHPTERGVPLAAWVCGDCGGLCHSEPCFGALDTVFVDCTVCGHADIVNVWPGDPAYPHAQESQLEQASFMEEGDAKGR